MTLPEYLNALGLPAHIAELYAARAGAPWPRSKQWLLWEKNGLVDKQGLTAKGEALLQAFITLSHVLDVDLA